MHRALPINIALVLALAACSAAPGGNQSDNQSATRAVAPAATGLAEAANRAGASTGVTAVSELDGFSFAATATLPPSGRKAPFNGECTHYRIAAKSAGATQAAQQDWTVTSEARLGRYDVLSLADQLVTATSGVCQVEQGAIALFDGDRLVAFATAKDPKTVSIGQLSSRDNGTLLVGDGEGPVAPIALLREEQGKLILAALPAEERLCAGTARLPNVYGKPIRAARSRLLAAGWQPAPQPTEDGADFGREADMRKAGITELESCSGTGYGFCNFEYVGKAGRLSITTVGEDPHDFVTAADVTCGKQG